MRESIAPENHRVIRRKVALIVKESSHDETENLLVLKVVPTVGIGQAKTENASEVMKAKRLQKEIQRDRDQVLGGDLIRDLEEIVIILNTPDDHVQGHIRGLRDRVQSQNHDINLRVVKGRGQGQGSGIGDLDQEVRTEGVRVQGVDPVQAVENHIIVVGHGPLVVVGVRGHTDIESSRNYRLYFITAFIEGLVRCVLHS